jgi:hypothetical protein
MQLLYMGFEQAKNVRDYIFHKVERGEETRVFVVSTEMSLFLEFRLGLQEGPILCLRTLAAEIETLGPARLPPPRHTISAQDIQAYLISRPTPGAKKAGFKKPAIAPR